MTELRPYLYRSFALHAAALAAFLVLAPRSAKDAVTTYAIDFVGSTQLSSAAPASDAKTAAESAPPKLAPQADPDAWSSGKRRGPIALPRPSLLKGWKDGDGKAPPKPSLAPGTGANPTGDAGTPGASAGIATDMPNFPYPWYISQVRLMLWQSWQKRMPGAGGEGVVVFSIMRNGVPTDLRMESSSGDGDFDQKATDSVSAAAPFPPLPSGFAEPFLKIHLTLKAAP